MTRSATVCSHRPTIFCAWASSSFLSGGMSTSNHLLLVISIAAMTMISTRVRIGELEGRLGPESIVRPLARLALLNLLFRQELWWELIPTSPALAGYNDHADQVDFSGVPRIALPVSDGWARLCQ